jgi:enamine deaminase RidA (YjgF/YER057c/UK114 family)
MRQTEILSASRFEGSDVEHAACVKAGHWIFLNGIEATDYKRGIAASVAGTPGLPLHGLPKHRREGDYVVARIGQLLKQAGTSFANSVRLDQYYPTWKAVDPYHLSRKAAFGSYIPPSTSVIMRALLGPQIEISSSLLAVMPGGGREPVRVEPPNVTAPTWSGFASAIRSGDFVFVAGIMARGADNGSDARAHVPANSRWGGYEIRRQAEYIITEKLKPSLAAAGSSPGNVLKAQAYLRDIDDLPHFLDVWNAHFGARQCALTVLTAADFGLVDGNLEINLLAVADGAAAKKEIMGAGMPEEMCFGAPAVRAGDLLLFSGLHAADANGPIAGIAGGAGLPHLGIAARAQMEFILDHAERVCGAAGTTLANLARIHLFHTELADFHAAYQVCRERMGGGAVPFSAIQSPAPHPVPAAGIIADMWVYAP